MSTVTLKTLRPLQLEMSHLSGAVCYGNPNVGTEDFMAFGKNCSAMCLTTYTCVYDDRTIKINLDGYPLYHIPRLNDMLSKIRPYVEKDDFELTADVLFADEEYGDTDHTIYKLSFVFDDENGYKCHCNQLQPLTTAYRFFGLKLPSGSLHPKVMGQVFSSISTALVQLYNNFSAKVMSNYLTNGYVALTYTSSDPKNDLRIVENVSLDGLLDKLDTIGSVFKEIRFRIARQVTVTRRADGNDVLDQVFITFGQTSKDGKRELVAARIGLTLTVSGWHYTLMTSLDEYTLSTFLNQDDEQPSYKAVPFSDGVDKAVQQLASTLDRIGNSAIQQLVHVVEELVESTDNNPHVVRLLDTVKKASTKNDTSSDV